MLARFRDRAPVLTDLGQTMMGVGEKSLLSTLESKIGGVPGMSRRVVQAAGPQKALRQICFPHRNTDVVLVGLHRPLEERQCFDEPSGGGHGVPEHGDAWA